MADRPSKFDTLAPRLPSGKGVESLRDGLTPPDTIAIVLSVVWLIAVGAFFLLVGRPDSTSGFDSLRFVMTLMAIFLPVAMIWVAAAASRTSRIIREESRRLQAAVDGMRQTYLADRQAQLNTGSAGPSTAATVERKLAEIAQSAKKTETTLATFTSSRQPSSPLPRRQTGPSEEQPTLALGTPAEEIGPPLPHPDMIRALNFPDNEADTEGFAALRRALKDRTARQLIQASQDVLTLLSQDGIYMDDLRPDRARAEIWRRFAKGERGRAVASLGGIRDRSSLALATGRMREDTIFRDAAHHFLRLFDRMLTGFEVDASDADLAALSETRTARAFMLLGRVTGTFD
ncbi:hypothetical protein [Flavimaricola marinus]|uniref:Uncharacterized protein n=1 Tax=Flavimaricola marinus TaxID=1819565 RepID=A0A238LBR3_9RHOB|nr:hypothetical protein [Flavimaricola marinus]SMY06845.1 hypothetical protein LOM8899_00975 [Flavimaricola marinus]